MATATNNADVAAVAVPTRNKADAAVIAAPTKNKADAAVVAALTKNKIRLVAAGSLIRSQTTAGAVVWELIRTDRCLVRATKQESKSREAPLKFSRPDYQCPALQRLQR